ncbi:MAG: hypothetical protein ACOZF0_11260 [Thermodesulfobacteriota bacterium]
MANQNEKRTVHFPCRIWIISLMLLIMPCLILAQEDELVRTDDRYVQTNRVEVTIVKKRPDCVESETQQFVVYTSTRVFIPDGNPVPVLKEIPLAELPYPCRAWIDYEMPLNNRPHARRIEVIKVVPGAREAWSPEIPQ